MMKHWFLGTAAAILLSFAVVDSAHAEPSGGSGHAGAEHGDHGDGHGAGDHGDGHGAGDHGDGHGAGGHGDGHGHHAPEPFADHDGDGTMNWFDGDFAGDGKQRTFLGMFNLSPALRWGFHAINLALLVGVLVFFGRRPIGEALRLRSAEIRKDIDRAADLKSAAQDRFDAVTFRLNGLEDEIVKMREDASRTVEAEKAAITARAEASAARIADSAERSIRDETERARRALRTEAVELATQLAQETLSNKLQAEDRQRLAQDLLDSLENLGGQRG